MQQCIGKQRPDGESDHDGHDHAVARRRLVASEVREQHPGKCRQTDEEDRDRAETVL